MCNSLEIAGLYHSDKILLVDIDLHSRIGYEYETTTFRYDINSIQPCLSEMIKPTDISKPAVLENRFPCFQYSITALLPDMVSFP